METLCGLIPEVSLAVIDCSLPQTDGKLTSFQLQIEKQIDF